MTRHVTVPAVLTDCCVDASQIRLQVGHDVMTSCCLFAFFHVVDNQAKPGAEASVEEVSTDEQANQCKKREAYRREVDRMARTQPADFLSRAREMAIAVENELIMSTTSRSEEIDARISAVPTYLQAPWGRAYAAFLIVRDRMSCSRESKDAYTRAFGQLVAFAWMTAGSCLPPHPDDFALLGKPNIGIC